MSSAGPSHCKNGRQTALAPHAGTCPLASRKQGSSESLPASACHNPSCTCELSHGRTDAECGIESSSLCAGVNEGCLTSGNARRWWQAALRLSLDTGLLAQGSQHARCQAQLPLAEAKINALCCRYGVKYPMLYAPGSDDSANAFNCVQRGHQNSLEQLPHFFAVFAPSAFKVNPHVRGKMLAPEQLRQLVVNHIQQICWSAPLPGIACRVCCASCQHCISALTHGAGCGMCLCCPH